MVFRLILAGIFLLLLLAVLALILTRSRSRGRRSHVSRANRRGRPNHRNYTQLLRLLHGDRAAAERLLDYERLKNPGRPENWYWEKVIYDLKRDRRI